MKLEQICVSLELAKKLKESGYPQESLFSWVQSPVTGDKIMLSSTLSDECPNCYFHAVAPTVAELGEVLPDKIRFDNRCYFFLTTWKRKAGEFAVKYKPDDKERCYLPAKIAKTEANARAKMWLYLKKEGLLKN